MKQIPLSRGLFALVDDEDYAALRVFKWSVLEPRKGQYYACRHKKRGVTILMHRQIMNTPKGLVTAHIDGNGLNNTRSNLRVCTRGQSVRHNKKIVGKIPYRGVTETRNGFGAYLAVEGRTFYLGAWATPEDAGRAYDEGLLERSPDFGVPNFPDAATFDYDKWRSGAIERRLKRHDINRALSKSRHKTTTKVPFRGVYFHEIARGERRYIARIGHRGKCYYLGYFNDPKRAALAYDKKARELGKPDASLNFPIAKAP